MEISEKKGRRGGKKSEEIEENGGVEELRIKRISEASEVNRGS